MVGSRSADAAALGTRRPLTDPFALLAPSPSAAKSERQAERALPVEARADEAAKAERGIERLRGAPPLHFGACEPPGDPQITV